MMLMTMQSKRLLYELDNALTLASFGRISLKLYPDCKPHNLKIANLQKGLVLAIDGKEIIEEGIGFGVPVAKYADKTFFPGSSKVFIDKDHGVIEKVFAMDIIPKKRIRKGPYLNDFLCSSLHKIIAKGYIHSRATRSILDRLDLEKTFGICTHFVKTEPRGWISIIYKTIPKGVSIEVDLRGLKRSKCKGIIILNEQGSHFFRRYFDTKGLELFDDWIGVWDKVEADEASLSDVKGKINFSLRKMPKAVLHRGREQIEGILSWAGLSYFLEPDLLNFSYSIRIDGDIYG